MTAQTIVIQRSGSEKESERKEGVRERKVCALTKQSSAGLHLTRRHAPSRHTCRLCLRPLLRHRGTLVVLPFIVCAITAHFVLSGRLRRHGTSVVCFCRLRRHGALESPFAGIVHLFGVLTRCSFSNFSQLILRHHGTSARPLALRHHGALIKILLSAPSRHNLHPFAPSRHNLAPRSCPRACLQDPERNAGFGT